MRIPSIGVEEEYQLVIPETGVLSPKGKAVLRRASHETKSDIQHELHLEQIEMASPILHSTQEVRECLSSTRKTLMEAAQTTGSALAAAGTNPHKLPEHISIAPKTRYLEMVKQYRILAHELVIFGCHVHCEMPDRELGIQVMNRARPWLPLLLGMAANSPYWHGEDTGYASYRREVWTQWPMSGVPHLFESLADYLNCIESLVQAGAIEDVTKIYWDIRLPATIPTIEFRVFDVQTEIEDAVALVAITRAMVMRCEQATNDDEPFPRTRHEIMQAAMWRAARYGLSDKLIDPFQCKPVDAFTHVEGLLEFLREPLQELGDLDLVNEYVERLRETGTPAERQRQRFNDAEGQLASVVQMLVDRTVA